MLVTLDRSLKGSEIAQALIAAAEQSNFKVHVGHRKSTSLTLHSEAKEKIITYSIQIDIPLEGGILHDRYVGVHVWLEADKEYEKIELDVYMRHPFNRANSIISGALLLCGILPGLLWMLGTVDAMPPIYINGRHFKEAEPHLRVLLANTRKELEGSSREVSALESSSLLPEDQEYKGGEFTLS